MTKVEIYKKLVIIKRLIYLHNPEDQKDALEGLTDLISDLQAELPKRLPLSE